MNINDLTIGEAKESASILGGNASTKQDDNSFALGEKYLIRTVTMMYTGKLARVTKHDILLTDAAWIADSGRYADALKKGTLNEIEPYPNEVAVSRAAIVDFAIWSHDLPREQK